MKENNGLKYLTKLSFESSVIVSKSGSHTTIASFSMRTAFPSTLLIHASFARMKEDSMRFVKPTLSKVRSPFLQTIVWGAP